ncbi:Protein of unknown function [Gryllus bimaculatus]|nr:Protein of unknown function [Gryllus bimaculatus]
MLGLLAALTPVALCYGLKGDNGTLWDKLWLERGATRAAHHGAGVHRPPGLARESLARARLYPTGGR